MVEDARFIRRGGTPCCISFPYLPDGIKFQRSTTELPEDPRANVPSPLFSPILTFHKRRNNASLKKIGLHLSAWDVPSNSV